MNARRHERDEEAAAGAGGGEEPPAQRRRLMARHLEQPRAVSPMDFRDRMASRYASELDVLWADFQVAVAALPETLPPDGRPLLPKSTLGEYLRAEKEILRRSGLLDGDVVSMGSDELWQLGDPDHVRDIDEKLAAYPPLLVRTLLEKDVRQVSAGGLHSLALDSDGVPYSWGCPDNGAIGRETPEDPLHDTCLSEATPSPVAGFTTVTGVNEDGTICQIAAGKSHSLFLSQAGNVYVCGYYKDNESGEYSDAGKPGGPVKGFNDRPVHVYQIPAGRVRSIHTAAGAAYSVVILDDFSILTWGFGNSGELARSANMTTGTPDEHGNMTYELDSTFYYEKVVVSIDKNGDENTVIKPIQRLVRDKFLTPQPPIWAGPRLKRTVLAVSTGSYHLLVAARDPGQTKSKLWTSGLNQYGQLGHGDKVSRHELTPVQALEDRNIAYVAGGEHHSLALSLDGTELWGFGRADYWQLGIGNTGEGSYVLDPSPVPFPPEAHPLIISEIAAGDNHSVAITINRDVYTWGFGETGPTGHITADEEDVMYPTKLNYVNSALQNGKYGGNAVAHQVSGGSQHSLMLIKRYL